MEALPVEVLNGCGSGGLRVVGQIHGGDPEDCACPTTGHFTLLGLSGLVIWERKA
jgi:hypothetical protein